MDIDIYYNLYSVIIEKFDIIKEWIWLIFMLNDVIYFGVVYVLKFICIEG